MGDTAKCSAGGGIIQCSSLIDEHHGGVEPARALDLDGNRHIEMSLTRYRRRLNEVEIDAIVDIVVVYRIGHPTLVVHPFLEEIVQVESKPLHLLLHIILQ